jgi:hypothetical protein
MKRAILNILALLERFAFLAIASTLLFLCPSQLAAQAPGSNPTAGTTAAGTSGAQGDATGDKKEHHKRTPQEVEQAFRGAKTGKVKKSPKIKNTHNSEDAQIAAIIAALEKLRAGASGAGPKPGGKAPSGQTANAGGSSPSGTPPVTGSTGGRGKTGAGSGGNSRGTPTPPTSAGGSMPGGTTPGTPGSPAGTARTAVPVANVAMARAPLTTAPPASAPSSSPITSTSLASRAQTVQPGISNVVACGSKMLMIQSVNGVATSASNPNIVFTQDPQYDDYKISGCNFGASQGQAHLNGPFRAGQVAMQIASWTDTLIELKVPTNLTGEPDQNSVSLVIVPSGGAQAQLQNCKFYAMRQEVTLTHLSQGQVTLGSVTDTGGSAVSYVKFSSPYRGQIGQGSQTSTAAFAGGVDRYDTFRFGAGTDTWDFSSLAAGFVPTQFSLSHWALDQCDETGLIVGDTTVYDDGQWSAQWDPSNPKHLIVNFAEQHCHETDGSDESNSSYALEVQVSGPVGVNPLP